MTAPAGDAGWAVDLLQGMTAPSTRRSTIGCIIPAYNEESTIAGVLDSLLSQTRLPDVVHVVVNNTTDATAEIAGHYAGMHVRGEGPQMQRTEIFVHDIGENPDKKVGALNYGFTLVEGLDYLLGVDGDTTGDPRAVELLVAEIEDDDRIGGISAIYSIDDTDVESRFAKFLIAGQRAQFAAFNLQNLLRGRNMAVLGGQYSIFAVEALHKVVEQTHQRFPWVRDSEIEDSLLSLQIKSAGYLTKISAAARANVGGMADLRSLDAQQVKWNTGAIDLMWPGQRGDTKGQPFHPNLRLRWFENISMVVNGFTRLGFLVLLVCSVSFNAFEFSPLWLIPPFIATLLNTRVALAMHDANRKDYVFAMALVPAEVYMWIRLGHFSRSWFKFATRAIVAVVIAALIAAWWQLPDALKSDALVVGWTTLGIVTIAQTAWLLLRALRRHRGFRA